MLFRECISAFLHFLFPHLCPGCGAELEQPLTLCLRCLHQLPFTGFEPLADNPVEKVFWGRMNVVQASSTFYYTRDSLMQELIKNIKYKGAQSLCSFLGSIMGQRLAVSGRFNALDAIVPLPLHYHRRRERGYNQSELLAAAISKQLEVPLRNDLVIRSSATSTQTRKGRKERWQNMEGRFELRKREASGLSILLVDDVLTTGATLEACGSTLLEIPGLQVSIATLCFADGD